MTALGVSYRTIRLVLLFLVFPLSVALAEEGPASWAEGAMARGKEWGLDADLPLGGISGIVTDHAGRPIADANLEVEPAVLEHGLYIGYDGLRFRSGEDGRFILAGVPSGSYTLRVRDIGDSFYGIDQQEVVNVPADSTAEVTLAIPVAKIYGKVVRAGKPAPGYGVHVSLIDPTGEIEGRVISQEPDGRYRMDYVPVGDATIALVDPKSIYFPRILRRRALQINPGDEVEVNWDAPTASVSGMVFYKASGSPAATAEVFLVSYDLRQGPQTVNWIYGGVRTSPDGRFEISGLPPGRYQLEVLAPSMVSSTRVDLSEGQAVKDLRIELVQSGAISFQLALPRSMDDPFFSLHLWLEKGEGVDGVPVLMPKRLNPDSIEDRPTWWSTNRKDMEIPGLAPGIYSLTLYTPQFGSLVREGIEVRPGETTQVNVEPKPAVQVSLMGIDAENQPINMPTICLTTASGASVGSTQSRYFVCPYPVFACELQPGKYRVRVEKGGFQPVDLLLDLDTPGSKVVKTVTLLKR